MGFLQYMLLGAVAYFSGWAVQRYVLATAPTLVDKQANRQTSQPVNKHTSVEANDESVPIYTLKHPRIVRYLGLFFMAMLLVSALISHFVLQHPKVDMLFVLVNSLVATFVFSFGLLPDHTKHEVPH